MLFRDLDFDADLKFNSYAHGVMVGNEKFCVKMTNGSQHSETRVLIFDLHPVPKAAKELLIYNTRISGLFSLYKDEYAVVEYPVCTLRGVYDVYHAKNHLGYPVVIFEKVED